MVLTIHFLDFVVVVVAWVVVVVASSEIDAWAFVVAFVALVALVAFGVVALVSYLFPSLDSFVVENASAVASSVLVFVVVVVASLQMDS